MAVPRLHGGNGVPVVARDIGVVGDGRILVHVPWFFHMRVAGVCCRRTEVQET